MSDLKRRIGLAFVRLLGRLRLVGRKDGNDDDPARHADLSEENDDAQYVD